LKIDQDGIVDGQMNSADATGIGSLEVDGLQIKRLVEIENLLIWSIWIGVVFN